MKKTFCYLLSACFLAVSVFFVQAFAANSEEGSIDGYVNNGEVLPVSTSEAEAYKQYELQRITNQASGLDENADEPLEAEEEVSTGYVTAADIESLCEVTDSYALSGVNSGLKVVEYSSDTLQNYLTHCKEITSIWKMNYLYVEYLSTDGMEVILCYSDDGLVNKSIYNPETDTDVFISADTAEMYTHFREGEQYVMPDDVSEQIDEYIDAEDWDAIEAMDGITVVEFGDGTRAIEPEIDTGIIATDD